MPNKKKLLEMPPEAVARSCAETSALLYEETGSLVFAAESAAFSLEYNLPLSPKVRTWLEKAMRRYCDGEGNLDFNRAFKLDGRGRKGGDNKKLMQNKADTLLLVRIAKIIGESNPPLKVRPAIACLPDGWQKDKNLSSIDPNTIARRYCKWDKREFYERKAREGNPHLFRILLGNPLTPR